MPSFAEDRKDARRFETEYRKEYKSTAPPKEPKSKTQSHLRVPAGVFTEKPSRVTHPVYNQTVNRVDLPPTPPIDTKQAVPSTSQYRYAWVDELARQYSKTSQ